MRFTVFLHVLGVLFGIAALVCAVVNMFVDISSSESMVSKAWSYTKKTYIFLSLMILSLVISYFLRTL